MASRSHIKIDDLIATDSERDLEAQEQLEGKADKESRKLKTAGFQNMMIKIAAERKLNKSRDGRKIERFS